MRTAFVHSMGHPLAVSAVGAPASLARRVYSQQLRIRACPTSGSPHSGMSPPLSVNPPSLTRNLSLRSDATEPYAARNEEHGEHGAFVHTRSQRAVYSRMLARRRRVSCRRLDPLAARRMHVVVSIRRHRAVHPPNDRHEAMIVVSCTWCVYSAVHA